jgi:hypothetical protein
VIEEVAGTEEEEKAANCHKCGQSAHPDPIWLSGARQEAPQKWI